MTLNLFNTIILFGIVQSIAILVLMIFTKKWERNENLMLMLVSLVLAFSLTPFFIGNSGLIDGRHYLRFLPLDLSLFFFPLFYYYFKVVFQKEIKFEKASLIHLILPGIFWFFHLFVWIKTLAVPEDLKHEVAVAYQYFQVQTWHQIMLALTVVGYGYLTLRLFVKAKSGRLSKDQISFSRWSKALLVLIVIGFLLDLASISIGKHYGYWKGSPFDVWLGMPFTLLVKIYYAILLYMTALVGYACFSDLSKAKIFRANYDTDACLIKITQAMEASKLYLNPNLTLKLLADEINMTPALISTILNHEIKMSYNDFVNRYRVQEIKSKLETDAVNKFTLLALAKDAGFKSKTTFYRAFQKFEQKSPKSYLQEISS